MCVSLFVWVCVMHLFINSQRVGSSFVAAAEIKEAETRFITNSKGNGVESTFIHHYRHTRTQ